MRKGGRRYLSENSDFSIETEPTTVIIPQNLGPPARPKEDQSTQGNSMLKSAPRYTAAQVILLAAEDLMAQGASEFSEWDLTIASWNRDKKRFGLRGYDQTHPDHKRVMMEIMGRKPQNPMM